MTQSPILTVLSTMRQQQVQCLLIGGQACVLYGGAEFSRDTDLAILASPENLARLTRALDDLQATVIAVPPFSIEYLDRGHAVHFRCRRPDVAGMRVDVLAKLRGVDPFPDLWARRTTVEVPEGEILDALSLLDLVKSKKTQRDKDWPMLRRLLEAHYVQYRVEPTEARVSFWLSELRTPSFLIECAGRFRDVAVPISAERPAVSAALEGNDEGIVAAFTDEERREREADTAYWKPLRQELETLRQTHRKT